MFRAGLIGLFFFDSQVTSGNLSNLLQININLLYQSFWRTSEKMANFTFNGIKRLYAFIMTQEYIVDKNLPARFQTEHQSFLDEVS